MEYIAALILAGVLFLVFKVSARIMREVQRPIPMEYFKDYDEYWQ